MMRTRAFLPVMALLLAAPVLVGTLQAQAQPFAIYNYRGTSTTSGGGSNVVASTSGYLALEGDGKATYVGLIASGPKRNRTVSYQVNQITNYLTKIFAPRDQNYVFLVRAASPGPAYANFDVASYQAKMVGLDSIVTLKNDDPANIITTQWPKTFKSSSLAVAGTINSSTEFVTQQSGTYTFNPGLTVGFNNAGLSVDDFILTRTNSEFAGISEKSAPAP